MFYNTGFHFYPVGLTCTLRIFQDRFFKNHHGAISVTNTPYPEPSESSISKINIKCYKVSFRIQTPVFKCKRVRILRGNFCFGNRTHLF